MLQRNHRYLPPLRGAAYLSAAAGSHGHSPVQPSCQDYTAGADRWATQWGERWLEVEKWATDSVPCLGCDRCFPMKSVVCWSRFGERCSVRRLVSREGERESTQFACHYSVRPW